MWLQTTGRAATHRGSRIAPAGVAAAHVTAQVLSATTMTRAFPLGGRSTTVLLVRRLTSTVVTRVCPAAPR